MTIAAVLFDLYGTLVPGGTANQRDAVSVQMAADLKLDPVHFVATFEGAYDARVRGQLGDLTAALRTIAACLGAQPNEEAVIRAVGRREEFTRSLHRGSWALPLLDRLRASGLVIGVISDCSADTLTVWPSSELACRVDVTAFSCVVGVRKPDARIYRAALEQIRVSPRDCLYIGDGDSEELAGARDLGMRAIWLDTTKYASSECINPEVAWTGERIANLNELVELIWPAG